MDHREKLAWGRKHFDALKPGLHISGYQGPIEQGTIIAKWFDEYGPGGLHPDMYVRGKLGFDVEFAPSWIRAKSIRELFPIIHNAIEHVTLPPLEALL